MKNVVILIVLFFVLRALKRKYLDRPASVPPPERGAQGARKSGAERPERAGEDMVFDPVCQSYVPISSAVSAVFDGRTEYFCSEECRSKFKAGE